MKTCKACGGVLGKDCFNEKDCMDIYFSAAAQHTSQIQSELDWERSVVVPDLEEKLSLSLVTILDLCAMLKSFELDKGQNDFVNRSMAFYTENKDHRKNYPSYDSDDLPF